jgi:hypothetical protein
VSEARWTSRIWNLADIAEKALSGTIECSRESVKIFCKIFCDKEKYLYFLIRQN